MSIKYRIVSGQNTYDFNTLKAANEWKQRNNSNLPVNEVDVPAPVVEAQIPQQVTTWQLRAAITLAGLKPQVETALNQLPEPNKTVGLTAWEYSNTILRYSPTILALQQLVGLTKEQVDNLFIQAEHINA